MAATPARHVSASDGVRLAVYEAGPAAAAIIVAIHGYPDTHAVWDGVSADLAARYRVVRYDVRGAGDSGRPKHRTGYRLTQLVADLATVLDAVSPAAPVHLLAHDRGSIQAWTALGDPRLAGRIASLTSISGPSLDYAAAWLRTGYRHPAATVRQLLDSWYLLAVRIPRLPEALIRSGRGRRLLPARGEAELVNGLELYRANLGQRRPGTPPRPIDVPVQVLAPRADRYVSVALQTQAPRPFVRNLEVRVLGGGHWIVSERPDVIARCTAEFVDRVAGPAG
jgi:pimeloyl-ACP methyl ester carboxylesterase